MWRLRTKPWVTITNKRLFTGPKSGASAVPAAYDWNYGRARLRLQQWTPASANSFASKLLNLAGGVLWGPKAGIRNQDSGSGSERDSQRAEGEERGGDAGDQAQAEAALDLLLCKRERLQLLRHFLQKAGAFDRCLFEAFDAYVHALIPFVEFPGLVREQRSRSGDDCGTVCEDRSPGDWRHSVGRVTGLEPATS